MVDLRSWRWALSLSLAMGAIGSGAARAEFPRGWGGGGKDYELVRDNEIKHGGTSSGAIRSAADAKDGFGTFTQGVQAAKFRGKRARLSGWIKADGVAGWSGLWMRIDGKEKTGIAFDNMADRAIKDTSDWTQFQVVLDVPDAAEQIYFGCLLAGKGKVWVDDLTLETVASDVAATGKPRDGTPRQGQTAELPAEPANLDFEG